MAAQATTAASSSATQYADLPVVGPLMPVPVPEAVRAVQSFGQAASAVKEDNRNFWALRSLRTGEISNVKWNFIKRDGDKLTVKMPVQLINMEPDDLYEDTGYTDAHCALLRFANGSVIDLPLNNLRFKETSKVAVGGTCMIDDRMRDDVAAYEKDRVLPDTDFSGELTVTYIAASLNPIPDY